ATPTPKPRAAVRLVRGAFRGADDHATSGTATVVRLADGRRRLTFTGFESDGGVDVRVYLVAGDGRDVSDHVELGRLKGEAGDQQYTIPADVDLSRYGTVVLWCVPFTVRVGVAPLS
ncbi:MAG: DM13 domain-containing protein, partial [Actinomycetota bacterium]|nr:DM13 domain-containing protein [Actinomycetota bacterium]